MSEEEIEFEREKRWSDRHPNKNRDQIQIRRLIMFLTFTLIAFGLSGCPLGEK